MKMMRNVLFIVAMQFTVTLFLLLNINTYSIIYDTLTLEQILIMVLAILSTVIVLIYFMWFDRKLLDALVDREYELRCDVFNQEEEIRNHEIFRDINVIKVMAQNNETKALKAYIVEELDGY